MSERGQRKALSHDLSTLRWDQQEEAQEKGTRSLESFTFYKFEASEQEHEHTSTSEDDQMNLWSIPEYLQTCTRFDMRAKTCRSTLFSGPLWKNVLSRITVDDKTGHDMSGAHATHERQRCV